MDVILVILAFVLIYFLTRSEKLDGVGPDTDYIETIALETPDRNQAMIFATAEYLKTYHKIMDLLNHIIL